MSKREALVNIKHYHPEDMANASNIWRKLVGKPHQFSLENRMFNSVCIITGALLSLVIIVNIRLNLLGSLYINVGVLCILMGIYYLSRFKQQYKAGVILYALSSYATVFVNYFYNGGIDGPTIFAFFLTFQLLIAISSRSLHLLWTTLHISVAVILMLIEYYDPRSIQVHYLNTQERYIDLISTYVICLLFIYVITIHLRNSYIREKKLADQRSEEIKIHLKEIEDQNEKLKEIAWMQSHKVRGKVATILGLCQFIDAHKEEDPHTKEVLKGIVTATHELDDVIKEINELTKKAEIRDKH